MDLPSNVPLHADPLVFIHVFISVKISSATRECIYGKFGASLWLTKPGLFAFHCRQPAVSRLVCQAVPQDCLETSRVNLALARLQVKSVAHFSSFWVRHCLTQCLPGDCNRWRTVEASRLPTGTTPRLKKCYPSPI